MRITVILMIATKLCAAQSSGRCGEVPIAQWAGQESLHTNVLKNPVGMVIIQHTVFRPCTTDVDCRNVLRMIRAYHMNKRGFSDIGPSFLVGGNGVVYEGAGWSRVGSHSIGYNNISIGLTFLGDFREVLPTPAALQVAHKLIDCGVRQGFLRQDYILVGHMQVQTTLSPGAALQREISTWPHFSG